MLQLEQPGMWRVGPFAAVADHHATFPVYVPTPPKLNQNDKPNMDTLATDSGQVCIEPDPHAGLIQLQIAPRVNHRIRFSAHNTTRTQPILPGSAVRLLDDLARAGGKTETVLIHGPGDPLSSIDVTLEAIGLLKKQYPDLKILLRTLGIGGLQYADRLEKAGVSEVEILVDGVEPEVLEKVYAWIRPGFKTLQLSEAAAILQTEQAQAIQAFKDAGLHVRILTTLYPTANDSHLLILAKRVAELGADELTLQPYTPEPGADIVLPAPGSEDINEALATVGAVLPVRQGRPTAPCGTPESSATQQLPKPTKEKPNVAVVSSNGMDIDLHLGQASQLLVYGPREDGLNCLLEVRPAPEPGVGGERWDILAQTIPDCFALITASAGDRPRQVLDSHAITVLITEENIEGTVDKLYGGGKKPSKKNT